MQLSPPFSLPNFALFSPFHIFHFSLSSFNFCFLSQFIFPPFLSLTDFSLSLSDCGSISGSFLHPRCVALSMPESSFSICDLPFVPIYLLLAQFGDSTELLIYQRVNSSCLSLSRRFKAFIFGVRFWIFI